MKSIISTRAHNALQGTPYTTQNAPAICALINYAAQPPGLDFANYGDRTVYRQESQQILRDWKRVKGALHECAQLEVTDQMVIEAAPRAFSGRLAWCRTMLASGTNHGCWDYCTGQYWPTEYRKAAAAVLEYAAHAVRATRPPRAARPTTIAELKELNRENGGCWFSLGNMRSFRCKIESGINAARFFISSEQPSEDDPRKYTLRSFDEFGQITTVGNLGEHATGREARAAMYAAVKNLKPVVA